MLDVLITFILSLVVCGVLALLSLKTGLAKFFLSSEINRDAKAGKYDLLPMKKILAIGIICYPVIIALIQYGYLYKIKYLMVIGIVLIFVDLIMTEVMGIVKGYDTTLKEVMDVNNDGKINKDDLVELLDKNGDGKITKEDFIKK